MIPNPEALAPWTSWGVLLLAAAVLLSIVGCLWQRKLRRDRVRHEADRTPRRRDLSPLSDMYPPGWMSRTEAQLHLSILEVQQRQLAADYVRVPDPTPLDDCGRVAKVGVDFHRGGAA